MVKKRMLITSLIIVLFLFLTGCSLPHSKANISTFNISPVIKNVQQSDIEKEKIFLETQKLKEEYDSRIYSLLIQFIPIILAFVTLIITTRNTSKALKLQSEGLSNQIRHNEKERVSNLLKELGNTDTTIRLSAIQALSEYSNSIQFLINVLKIDNNSDVISTCLAALLKMPTKTLPYLLDESKSLLEKQFELASKLLCLGMSKEEITENFFFDIDEVNSRNNDYRNIQIQKTLNWKISSTQKLKNLSISEITEEEKTQMIGEWISTSEEYERIIKAISRIIELISRSGDKYDLSQTCLRGIFLEGVDLSGWNFNGADLRRSRFAFSNCQKAVFTNTDLTGANFNHALLSETKFDYSVTNKTNFIATKIDNASFISSKGVNAKFHGATIKDTDFATSELKHCFFENTKQTNNHYTNAKLYSTVFCKSELKSINFSSADLSGTDLSTTKSDNCNFSQSIFAGTNLNDSSFVNSTFIETRFKKIKSFQNVLFKNNFSREIVYIDDSMNFSEFYNKEIV